MSAPVFLGPSANVEGLATGGQVGVVAAVDATGAAEGGGGGRGGGVAPEQASRRRPPPRQTLHVGLHLQEAFHLLVVVAHV